MAQILRSKNRQKGDQFLYQMSDFCENCNPHSLYHTTAVGNVWLISDLQKHVHWLWNSHKDFLSVLKMGVYCMLKQAVWAYSFVCILNTKLPNLETCAHTDNKILCYKFRHWSCWLVANWSSNDPIHCALLYAILHTLIHTLCLSKYATLPITLTADARSLQNLSPWNSKSVWIMPTVLTCAVITLCEH